MAIAYKFVPIDFTPDPRDGADEYGALDDSFTADVAAVGADAEVVTVVADHRRNRLLAIVKYEAS